MNHKTRISFWLMACLLLVLFDTKAQTNGLKGKVIDKKTGEALPFVHIVFNAQNEGITSNIDGGFDIVNTNNVDFLKFSYIGYEPVNFRKSDLPQKQMLIVYMTKKTFDLSEVNVYPRENPAHRIINAVIKNRKENNPEKLDSYSYKAYHKTYYTIDFEKLLSVNNKDSTNNSDSFNVNSSYRRLKNLIKEKHLFLMESVSERKYKRPGKIREEVLASRVSGFKDPSIVMLATQLQSFSFYDEMFTLLESRYVNPISRRATNRYFFNIEDTTYTEKGDTVFSISFRPKKGKNFESLKGVLNINSYKYAVQSVVAEPVEDVGMMNLKIVQNYKLIDEKYWFPNELNTTIVFSNLVESGRGQSLPMVAISKSYIEDVVLDEKFKNNEFSAVELDVKKKAFTRNDSIWNVLRGDSLGIKERNTYLFIDSIGEKHNFDLKLKTIKALSYGYVPVKFIDFDPFNLLNFNVYEGYRPGIRLKTNEKVSGFYQLRGFGAYGFNDKKWKYGGAISFNLVPKRETKLEFDYQFDVKESAGYNFFEEVTSFNSTEFYRQFFIKDMTYHESYTTSFEFRALKKWKVRAFASLVDRFNTSDYTFIRTTLADEPSTIYHFQEFGVRLRYAPNERKTFVAGELFNSESYTSPVFYINYSKGLKTKRSNFSYTKIEAKMNFSFLSKSFGRTNLQIVGGKVFGDLPYFMLYNGHGSYYGFDVETSNSFATMRMNEFLSDEFAAVHFRQDFASLLFKTKKFKPEIIMTTSVGFGRLEKPELHSGIEYKTMEQGFYESGLLFNYLVRQLKFIGYGLGVFYRYGPYSYSNNSDNFALKFTLMLKL